MKRIFLFLLTIISINSFATVVNICRTFVDHHENGNYNYVNRDVTNYTDPVTGLIKTTDIDIWCQGDGESTCPTQKAFKPDIVDDLPELGVFPGAVVDRVATILDDFNHNGGGSYTTSDSYTLVIVGSNGSITSYRISWHTEQLVDSDNYKIVIEVSDEITPIEGN